MQYLQTILAIVAAIVFLLITAFALLCIGMDSMFRSGVIRIKGLTLFEHIKERWERDVARCKSRRFKHRKAQRD